MYEGKQKIAWKGVMTIAKGQGRGTSLQGSSTMVKLSFRHADIEVTVRNVQS